ncbi:MAG: hypothetical protein KGP14_06250 [Betaproteobacteria bacterium]|nr:hypothetical protein [Betaproteobacteria bacterium]
MRILFAALACLAIPVQAAEPQLRSAARLLFKQPEMLHVGQCVRYEEGGGGWVMTDPVFYLTGEVVATEVQTRHLGKCPLVPGKSLELYSRTEFNRLALAHPCVSDSVPERDEQIGIVRIRVIDWETPYARKAENAGRLYRGMYIDKKLEKGMELQLEADLLGICSP